MLSEEDLPIDIQTSKLVGWLISRRHVKKNWHEAIRLVREKISHAIKDMPEHPDITKLLSGAYINYFHCLQIIEILRETEKESKNIFGWYTSQRMKDWQEIVHLYQKDNAYLAEASQYFVRNVNYEIPSLKNQISRYQQVEMECSKKIEDSIKQSTICKERYYFSCKSLGIPGENIRKEVSELLHMLPDKLRLIGNKVQNLSDATRYYQEYLQFFHSLMEQTLPLLCFITEHGDTTLYEWKYGEPPLSIEKSDDPVYEIKQVDVTDGIDFGPADDSDPGCIDYGDEAELETGAINWGNFGEEDPEAIDQEIDFGKVEEVGADDLDIVIESSGVEGGIAKGEDAQTLLSKESTRHQFINELLELEAFFKQRRYESKLDDTTISISLFNEAPKIVRAQTLETISAYLKTIDEIIQDLKSTAIQHLFKIQTCPSYVIRLEELLRLHLKRSEKMLDCVDSLKKKCEDASVQPIALNQQLKVICTRTKELHDNIVKDISQKYKNRPVNLMGLTQIL